MSGSIFEVPLPNGTIVEVENAPNADIARARARLYFQQADPQGYAAWAAQQPAGGSIERGSRAIDEFQGRLYGTAEAIGAVTGIESLEQFGRRGAQRNVVEAEAAMPAARMRSFGEAEGVGGILRAGQQAIIGSLPELPGPIAGAVAGSRFGIPGAIIGAAIGSLPSLPGSNVQAQRQEAARQAGGVEPEQIPSPGLALAAAVPQALVGGALDVLTLRLARVLGVPAEEVGRTLLPRIARGIGAGAVTEVPEEVIQTAIQRAQAGQSLLDNDAMSDYYEAALGGAFAGGAFGGAIAGVAGRRPQAAQPPADQQPPAEAGAPEPPPEPLIPPPPEPITDPEQARAFVYSPGSPARRPRVDLDDAGIVQHANMIQQQDYESTVAALRENEVTNFLGGANRVREIETGTDEDGRPVVERDFSGAAPALLPRLYEAATAGDLSLTEGFTVQQVTDLALRRAEVDQPTASEYGLVRETLNGLARQGFLETPRKNTYRIAQRAVEPLRQAAFERAQRIAAGTAEGPTPTIQRAPSDWQAEQATRPTPQTRFDPNASPVVAQPSPQLTPEMKARREQAAQTFAAADPTPLLQQLATNNDFAVPYLDNFFSTIGKNPTQNSVMARARQDGIILTPEETGVFFARGRQLGLLNGLNNYIPPAKRAQRQQAPAAAAATQALNQIAQTGTPATISPQAAQQTAAAQQASEDLQQAVQAAPAPTLPRQLQTLQDSLPAGSITEVNYGGQQYTLRGTGARPTVAPTQEPLAQWQIDNMNAARDLLQRAPALGQRIRELHNQGMVARDIASTLNLDVNDVRAMRDALGLRPLGPTVTPGGAVIPEEGGQPTQPPPLPPGFRPSTEPPPAGFTRAGSLGTAQQPMDAATARQEGERAFRRVLGQNGRIEIEDRIFLEDLDAAVQQAAADAGITNIDGAAIGDLAILALRDGATPITDVAIHEGFHVAENMGLFTPNEQAILNANLDRIREVIRQRIPSVSEQDLANPSEVRAYGLNARVFQRADFGSTVNRIFDKLTNFVDRLGSFVRGRGFQSWRDVYDSFYAGEMANRQGAAARYPGDNANVNFAASGALRGDPKDQTRVQKTAKDELRYFLRWFGSPIMTIGKVRPNMRAVADTQKTLYTRANEAVDATKNLITGLYRLPPESVTKVTRAWQEASRTRKPPNTTGMSQQEIDALQSAMQSVQQALNFTIESMVIDNYLPTANKPPAVRQRLDKFWERHADKHLWEIPPAELRAASPEGYAEMQRLEKLRNPSYMPMIAQGSHFVAAYKRKPDGSRGEIVGLVAYSPRSIPQRLRGSPDQEAAAIQQLRSEFGDTRKFIVMDQGVQFTNDSQAQQIRNSADFIAQYMERIRSEASASGNKRVLQAVREMTNQMNKATIDRIFRPNNDILRAITPQNESSYLLDVLPQYLLSITKVQARSYTQTAYKDATKNLSQNDKAYWDELRDYATSPSEAFGNLRALAFYQYLGGALDTAFINLFQNFATNAMLTRDGGAEGSKIFGQVAARMGYNKKLGAKKLVDPSGFINAYLAAHANPQERAAIERAMRQGIFAPVFTNESRSQFTVEGLRRTGFKNPQRAFKFFNATTRWLGMPMQVVESYNRAVAFTAAYKLAQQKPDVITFANRVDGTNYTNAYDYAVGKVIDTQFLTTKEDRALFQRFHPAAELATQFLSYPFKAIEQYFRAGAQAIKGAAGGDIALLRAGTISLLLTIGPIVGLAGIFALPFVDFAKELAEDLIAAAWGTPQNFEADIQEWAGGGRFGEFLVGGAAQAYDIATLRRRLALDPVPYNDLINLSVSTLFGPVGSMIQIPQNMYAYYQNGDYWQMAASIMPRFAGNVVKGAQVAVDEEQFTRRGNRIITPEIVERTGEVAGLSAPVAAGIRTALGFAPPEFARQREIVAIEQELQSATRSRSERNGKELSRILLRMLEYRQANEMDRASAEVRRYTERLREIQQEELARPDYARALPNHEANLRRAIRDFYGIASEEAIQRSGRTAARPEVLRQRAIVDWRNQPPN